MQACHVSDYKKKIFIWTIFIKEFWILFYYAIFVVAQKRRQTLAITFLFKVWQLFFFCCYRTFHGFGQAKFAYGGSNLGSSRFTILAQLLLKMMLVLKVVKIDSKILLRDTLCLILLKQTGWKKMYFNNDNDILFYPWCKSEIILADHWQTTDLHWD